MPITLLRSKIERIEMSVLERVGRIQRVLVLAALAEFAEL
jgi:hypothetical protein